VKVINLYADERDAKGERLLIVAPGSQLDYWDGEA
jgi:hypothetical protein